MKPDQKISFVTHVLSNDVIWSGFWVILKIISANLCKSVYHINYSTSICPFEFGKCGKEGKKLQKLEYFENEKSFLDEIKKTFFIVFEGYHLVKKKKKIDKK